MTDDEQDEQPDLQAALMQAQAELQQLRVQAAYQSALGALQVQFASPQAAEDCFALAGLASLPSADPADLQQAVQTALQATLAQRPYLLAAASAPTTDASAQPSPLPALSEAERDRVRQRYGL